tara:strand:- start:296 stop:505 length:210 start_codon:yes stop_codon:yes gene_type:complete
MDSKQEALIQLVYEDLMEDRFAMEVPLFNRWWEIAIFLLLGLLLLPFFLLLYVWEYLRSIYERKKKRRA